ncbi:hypothetical protein [Gluconobacter sphaericus]|uniref:hypothetical protein n=1 Tax=Gluconobacter sphaericus TaxID=574987 RepID=UPI00192499DA|nr:hypothetical protein [Gluconobacter sphaericus]MBS1086328.1 hypothetical protein [Gluconobacter sphaericus]MBS1100326.1 hypothetical protein [Gluconobacter sphaericus]QQX91238.1 hypothetical protein IGS75_00905 [Gluconobacter sphaericus]
MMSDFSWLPGWAFGCLVVVSALFVLALLCMPFAVFGTKPRLQELEFQIAELRAELRALNMRLAVSTRPDSLSAGSDRQDLAAVESRAVYSAPTLPDEDYFMPAHGLRSDLPSYEDSPEVGGDEALPRRGPFSQSALREGISDVSERAWARAPWEKGASTTGRQPLGRSMDRMLGNKPVVEEDAYRPRSEPKLRWPPRD